MSERLSIREIFLDRGDDPAISRYVLKGALKDAFRNGFTFTEIANWLVDHFPKYQTKYSSSNIPKNYRVHTHRTYIQARLDQLVGMNILQILGTRPALKNGAVNVPFYALTESGIFLASLLESDSDEVSISTKAARQVYNILFSHLARRGTAMSILYQKIMLKIEQKDILQLYVGLMKNALTTGLYPLNNILDIVDLTLSPNVLTTFNLLEQHRDLFIESFNELDEEIQELVEFEFKLHAEHIDFSVIDAGLRWERTRLANANDSSKITLLGYCDQCRGTVVTHMPTIMFAVTEKILNLSDCPLRGCPDCGSDASVKIIPVWERTTGKKMYQQLLSNRKEIMEWSNGLVKELEESTNCYTKNK
jgi:hypothetical protein